MAWFKFSPQATELPECHMVFFLLFFTQYTFSLSNSCVILLLNKMASIYTIQSQSSQEEIKESIEEFRKCT